MKNIRKELWSIVLILFGNAVLAFGIAGFVLPSGIISGGGTGLALFANTWFGIDITVFVTVLNIALFVLGALVLGRRFAVTTALSTFFYPVALGVFQAVPAVSHLTGDPLLSALYAGLLTGAGVGIALRAGSSTGGTDIPPMILQKKFGVSVSASIAVLDTSILLLQVFYAESEQILYGILMTLLASMATEWVLMLGKSQTQVLAITPKYEEVSAEIQKEIGRGCTFLEATTGYRREQQRVVLCVLSHRELPRLSDLVLSIDPAAFLVVSRANEVKGRGFTLENV